LKRPSLAAFDAPGDNPRLSISSCVIRCNPPPDGVLQPLGNPMKSPVCVVCTSAMVLVADPVPMS